MTTGDSGNDRSGGGRDSTPGGVGGNDGTGGEPSARLARAARVVFVDTIDRCTAGFGAAAGADPDHEPAPEGAPGLAGTNLHLH
ncbi:hypothetical protein [Nannocystis pusilla]|uniref:hypothetical protein n=1 Tax=Nannocystis pusilla TaxID=889268 RepID=UPI003DA4F65E